MSYQDQTYNNLATPADEFALIISQGEKIIMWIADNWKDYEVIDCSKGEKTGTLGENIFWCVPTLR